MLDILPDHGFIDSNSGYVVTSRPEMLSGKVFCRPPNVRAMWMALLPFKYPMTWDTAYLGGMAINMWIWSISNFPSRISHSLCVANSRRTGPNSCRISTNSLLRRYFGIHTTWYLHSHRVWAKLWVLFIENLLNVEL